MITEVSEDIGSAPIFVNPLPKLVETNEGEIVRYSSFIIIACFLANCYFVVRKN